MKHLIVIRYSHIEEIMKNIIDIQIKVPNQTKYLSLIGNISDRIAREICQLPENKESFANNINIVLTEAMVNAIKHANKSDPQKEITIKISISDIDLSIMVFDNGNGFDLTAIEEPSFENNQCFESGRGIYIIRALMDSVIYKKTASGNVLEMRKSLS